jgi:hypothetical protein
LGTGKVSKGSGELRKEEKVMLLRVGEGGARFGDGCHQRFVICEKRELAAFKEKTEMANRKVGSEEFPIKGGIAGFSGRKFVGENFQGTP